MYLIGASGLVMIYNNRIAISNFVLKWGHRCLYLLMGAEAVATGSNYVGLTNLPTSSTAVNALFDYAPERNQIIKGISDAAGAVTSVGGEVGSSVIKQVVYHILTHPALLTAGATYLTYKWTQTQIGSEVCNKIGKKIFKLNEEAPSSGPKKEERVYTINLGTAQEREKILKSVQQIFHKPSYWEKLQALFSRSVA